MRTVPGTSQVLNGTICKVIAPLLVLLIVLVVMAEISSCWDFGTTRILPASLMKGACRIDDTSRSKASFYVENPDEWFCSQTSRVDINRPFNEWLKGNATDEEALCAARRVSMTPIASGTPRIAFMFMTRGQMPLEILWQRFFADQQDKYTIYVHASDPSYRFPETSLFHGRLIPSKAVIRFGISETEAVRRLVAYALLDRTVPNAWFTLSCETSLPIRPFSYVYNYLLNSELSFVEAFVTPLWWHRTWAGKRSKSDYSYDRLSSDKIRKGEPWITVHRRHAGLIVGEFFIFHKFKKWWVPNGISFEIYMPTMFTLKDKLGIANRTLMFVNWIEMEDGGHPVTFDNRTRLNASLLREMQNQTANMFGFYKDVTPGFENEPSCVYNGVPNSACYLFARKFSGRPTTPDYIKHLLDLAPMLGY